jgi:addiction module HigA family antidote
MAKKTHFSPPGMILKREFLDGFGVSVSQAAGMMGMHRSRLNEIVQGKRAITADTALRLGQLLQTGAPFWLNLQSHYDLATAKASLKKNLARIPHLSDILDHGKAQVASS